MAEGDSHQAVRPIPYASPLPRAGRDAGYPEIVHYAKMLRFGGLLLVIAGWVGGILGIYVGTLEVRRDEVSGSILILSAIITIILLNALAALLAMIAFVGLAIRDAALHRE